MWIRDWNAFCPAVQKPARYVGGEFNAIMKDKSKVDTRVTFCFPDTYEIGMSKPRALRISVRCDEQY